MIKSYIEHVEGVDYLTFKPDGMFFPITIPVITKGSRDKSGCWSWNGDLENPTVRPSVKHTYGNIEDADKKDYKYETKIIHFWLNDGICKCLNDSTDGNAGKNLELSDVSSYKE